MTNFSINRIDITKKILAIINPDYSPEDLSFASKYWWLNIRPSGGLGLTERGKEAFENADIAYWDLPIKIENMITPAARLKLDRTLPTPYYMHVNLRTSKAKPYIRIYDSRVVVLSQLHGNFESYFHSLGEK